MEKELVKLGMKVSINNYLYKDTSRDRYPKNEFYVLSLVENTEYVYYLSDTEGFYDYKTFSIDCADFEPYEEPNADKYKKIYPQDNFDLPESKIMFNEVEFDFDWLENAKQKYGNVFTNDNSAIDDSRVEDEVKKPHTVRGRFLGINTIVNYIGNIKAEKGYYKFYALSIK